MNREEKLNYVFFRPNETIYNWNGDANFEIHETLEKSFKLEDILKKIVGKTDITKIVELTDEEKTLLEEL